MSTVTVRILTCDGTHGGEVCPAEFGGDQAVRSLAALRRLAQEQGWRRRGYCRDLCPDCIKKGED